LPQNVVTELEAALARQRARYHDHPLRELTALLLLAMEREQIVSIAYRDESIQRRLDTLPLPDDVRDIVRHGIAWAWKDEEMHAIYTRGLLLRIGGPWTRARTLMAQLAGALGGWASSVQQHARWSQAPTARALAALITGIGRAAGKVPRAIRDRLRFLSFRHRDRRSPSRSAVRQSRRPRRELLTEDHRDCKTTTDLGQALIDGRFDHVGKIKGPVLRGLSARAPFFHNGSAHTLMDVVRFYENRFGLVLTPRKESDLVAFLSAL